MHLTEYLTPKPVPARDQVLVARLDPWNPVQGRGGTGLPWFYYALETNQGADSSSGDQMRIDASLMKAR